MADSDLDQGQAARFAKLALDCVHKEYPNKIAHSLNSDADVKPPPSAPVPHDHQFLAGPGWGHPSLDTGADRLYDTLCSQRH